MPRAWGYVVALVALALVAPLIVGFAKRHGRSIRGGLGLGFILLGFGEVLDPPSKHVIEAAGDQERESPAPGEPPLES